MGKTELMILGTVIKFILGLGGLILTIFFLVTGLVKKDNSRIKKAGLIFLGTWIITLVIGAIEFLIAWKG